jgi:hypothetical protein
MVKWRIKLQPLSCPTRGQLLYRLLCSAAAPVAIWLFLKIIIITFSFKLTFHLHKTNLCIVRLYYGGHQSQQSFLFHSRHYMFRPMRAFFRYSWMLCARLEFINFIFGGCILLRSLPRLYYGDPTTVRLYTTLLGWFSFSFSIIYYNILQFTLQFTMVLVLN